jgi:predicted RNA-binding Zn ribbon-like protein
MGYTRPVATATLERAYSFDFTAGGVLCLDFTNTVGDRPLCREEHLTRYSDLLAWARQAGLLKRRDARALEAEAASHPAHADAAFARALLLRDSLYRIFAALARGTRPAPDDLGRLNTACRDAGQHLTVTPSGRCFSWFWSDVATTLDGLLWPIAWSAAQLLVDEDRPAIRECAAGTCTWLFLDRSRSHRRRWCSMTSCGNREKVRRFYARKRKHAAR